MDKVQVGMSVANVREIMGEPQNITSSSPTVFYYDYPTLNIKFNNNEVATIEYKYLFHEPQPYQPVSDAPNLPRVFKTKTETMKLLLFLFTYLAVVQVSFLMLSDIGINFIGLFPLNLLFPVGLIEIPSLLLRQPTQDRFYFITSPAGHLIAFFGWIMYFGIAIAGIKTQKRIAVVGLYILFILLLVGNVSGCVNQIQFIPKVPGL